MARILLVDDPDILTSCMDTLSQCGHECRGASRSHDAMRVVISDTPDLVVLNPHLGDDDGVQVLKAVKEFDPKMCVVLYTSSSLFGDSYDYFLADRTIVRQPDHGRLVSFVRSKFDSETAESDACTSPFHLGVF